MVNKKPFETQKRNFKYLINKGENTKFGSDHFFQKIKNYTDFSDKIPVRNYEDLFPWLEKCEKLFGFKDLQGFGKIRIYTFLAERFLPYWFNKNTKSTTLPIIFYDIRNDIN